MIQTLFGSTEQKAGFFERMKQAVTRTRESLSERIEEIATFNKEIDRNTLDELETTLIAAETFGNKLHAWTIRADGTLGDQRVFADLGPRSPDGLCVDVEGGVWVGCFLSCEFLRVLEGGEITDRVATGESWAVAPALGGPDMRTLYLVINDTTFEGIATGDSRCRIEAVEVAVPGAGSP